MTESRETARHDPGQLDFQRDQLLRYLTRQAVELRLWASDLVLEAVYGWHDCTEADCVRHVPSSLDAISLATGRLHKRLAAEADAGVDPWHLMHRADRAALLQQLRHNGDARRSPLAGTDDCGPRRTRR
jgi:hypothetical protein